MPAAIQIINQTSVDSPKSDHAMEVEAPLEETVPWALTLGATVAALCTNIFLLTALIRGGPVGASRNKGHSLLVLTATEIALTLFFSVHLMLHRFNWPLQRGALESGFHTLHTVRNGWLLVLTSCRTFAVVRPLRSRPDWFNWRQQTLAMLIITGLSVALVFASRALTTPDAANVPTSGTEEAAAETKTAGDWPKLAITATPDPAASPLMMTAANATLISLSAFREQIRPLMLSFASVALFGTLLPGTGVFCLGCRMAWALRRQTFQHKSSRRSCKMVLLLSFGFVGFEFPFAAMQIGSVAYMLCYPFETLLDLQPVVLRLDTVTAWSLLCVPLDSCLNFIVLMAYSRTFRASLQRLKRRKLPARRSPRPSATDSASKRLQAVTCV